MKKITGCLTIFLFCFGCAGMDKNWQEYARIQADHSERSARSMSDQVRAIQFSSSAQSRSMSAATIPKFQTTAEATMYSIMQQSQEMAIKAMEILALAQVKPIPFQMKAPMDSGTFWSNSLNGILRTGTDLLTLGLLYGVGNSTGNNERNMQLHAGESINYFQGNNVGKDLTNTYFRASESGIVNSGSGEDGLDDSGGCGPDSVQDPVTGRWYVDTVGGLSCESAGF